MKIKAFLRFEHQDGSTKDWAIMVDGQEVWVANGATGNRMQFRQVSIPGGSIGETVRKRTSDQYKQGYKDLRAPNGEEWVWDAEARKVVASAEAAAKVVTAAQKQRGKVLLTITGAPLLNLGSWRDSLRVAVAPLADVHVRNAQDGCELVHEGRATAFFDLPNPDVLSLVGTVVADATIQVIVACLAAAEQLDLVVTADGKTVVQPRKLSANMDWLAGYPWSEVLAALEVVGLYKPLPFAKSRKALAFV